MELVDAGLLRLTTKKPREINGVFAVPKDDDKQRLIIDARRANLHLVEPSDPELPHPGLFMQLENTSELPLWVCKMDLDNFYHRLELRIHFQTYFGLPSIRLNGRRVWPVVRSLPMGFSHSVVIAQEIHH